jgi:hypothetical protein
MSQSIFFKLMMGIVVSYGVFFHYSYAFLFDTLRPVAEVSSDVTANGLQDITKIEDQLKIIDRKLKRFRVHPRKVKRYLIELLPEESLFTIQPHFIVSGKVDQIKELIINNERVPVSTIFEYTLELPMPKTYRIELTFITDDNTYFTRIRYITKLISPVDINRFPGNKERLIKVYNSALLPHPMKDTRLNKPLTEYELESILAYGIGDQKESEEPPFLFRTLDQKSYPNDPVSSLQFYVRLLRALNFEPSDNTESPFNTVSAYHWSTTYLNSAIHHGILSRNSNFNPYHSISIGEALLSVIGQSPFNTAMPAHWINTPLNRDAIHADRVAKQQLLTKLNAYTHVLHQELVFDNLKNNQFYSTPTIRIHGYISPVSEFVINDTVVTPKRNGRFTYEHSFKDRVEGLTVTAFNKNRHYRVFQIAPYEDLKDHWIEQTALRLQYLGYIQPTQNFRPKSTLTLTDFMTLTGPFIHTEIMEPLFVSSNMVLNKAEVISLLIPKITTVNIESSLPFWDVSTTYWARKEIETAYSLQLISESDQLYPDQPITKAELIALLSNIPKIKSLLEETFKND